jgi:hypothetical protein
VAVQERAAIKHTAHVFVANIFTAYCVNILIHSLFDVPFHFAQVINKTGERFSQPQQYIIQLYNCHKILIVYIL